MQDGVKVTPLCLAVRMQDDRLLNQLLKKGANPNRKENVRLSSEILSNDASHMLDLLIRGGWKFNPNQPEGGEQYKRYFPSLPLVDAVSCEKIRLVKALLKRGADPYLSLSELMPPPDSLKDSESMLAQFGSNSFEKCDNLTKAPNLHPSELPEKKANQAAIKKLLDQYKGWKKSRIIEKSSGDGWSCEYIPAPRISPDIAARQKGPVMIVLLKENGKLVASLLAPEGTVLDAPLVDEPSGMAVIGIQTRMGTCCLNVLSLKDQQVYSVNLDPINKAIEERTPKEKPNRQESASSPYQLTSLSLQGDKVIGEATCPSVLSPGAPYKLMSIPFSLDLTQPPSKQEEPWNISIITVKDPVPECH